MCVILPNFVRIGQNVAEMWSFLIFQDGARPPSLICYTPVWTTDEEYLVVFVLLLCKIWFESVQQFQYYTSFNIFSVKLENVYSRPMWGCFVGRQQNLGLCYAEQGNRYLYTVCH